LQRAQERHDLLEQKRKILVLELMKHVETARRIKGQIVEIMASAYAVLQRAVLQAGSARLLRQSLGIGAAPLISIRMHSVMGVPVPEISLKNHVHGPEFSLLEEGCSSDHVLQHFRDALELVVELAEAENAIFRVAREVKRTQRRVNALEKTFIPDYKETLKRIEDALEERERESQIMMRKVERSRREEQ